MIRHRPHGSGHPYEPGDDARVPTVPVAGEPLELRASTGPDVVAVTVEWSAGDGTTVLEATLESNPSAQPDPQAAQHHADGQDGHLAAAAAGRGRRARVRWTVWPEPPAAGQRVAYRFTATHRDGRTRRTRWFEVAAASWQETGGTLQVVPPVVGGADRVVPGSVRWLVGPDGAHRVRFALPLGDGEHVVGFGERFDALDQRGRRLDAVVFEQYKAQGAAGRTYLPMPWAMVVGGPDGWGFHVRTSRRTWFDVGATDPDRLWVEADLGGDTALTLRLYEGTPAQVLGSFLDEVGRPAPLPDWVFRLWMSGNEWGTQRRVMAEVQQHADLDIPVGVLVVEAWSDESTFVAFRDARYPVHADGAPHRLADFTFPADGAWPDPKGMVDELHRRGIRVLLWQIPLQKMRPHPAGQAAADARVMVERGYGVRAAGGRPYRNRGWWFPLALLPDLTSPEARAWWLAKRRYLVEEVGVDGFKTDGGEHAWGEDLRYADGSTGGEGNNRYPVQYAAAYGELLAAAGKPPVTFSRAGFTGSQAHGGFWAGDEDSTWAAFRHSIIAGVTASASGIVYWGWDLGGFSGDVPDAELYLRAAAMACFAPIMQYHSEFNHHRLPSRDRTPWNVAARSGDPRVVPVFRQFARLRERLVGYLDSELRRGLDEGKPLMRALCFEAPDDPRIWEFPQQYFLGSALLVAPVTEPGATTWPVYLPKGAWVDAWTGAKHTGGRVIERAAPLSEIPVFVREDRATPVTLSRSPGGPLGRPLFGRATGKPS